MRIMAAIMLAGGVPVLHGPRWKFKTGAAIVSTPVVQGGTVYFGSSDHNFYAVSTASGALRWKFATGGRVTSSPAVAAGRVYFASYDSNFYALDAATGALIWKFATQGERRFSAKHLHGAEPAAEQMPDPFDTFLSSPVIDAGMVYFGSGDGNVYALEAGSGELRWKFQPAMSFTPLPPSPTACCMLEAGTVTSMHWMPTGKERWRFKTGEDPQSTTRSEFSRRRW